MSNSGNSEDCEEHDLPVEEDIYEEEFFFRKSVKWQKEGYISMNNIVRKK